jgi:hypothetical protein
MKGTGGTWVYTEQDHAEFREWLETRPQAIKDMAAKYPPDGYYAWACKRLGTLTVTLVGYLEDGRVRIRAHRELDPQLADGFETYVHSSELTLLEERTF